MKHHESTRRTISRVLAAAAVACVGLLTPASCRGYLVQQRWFQTTSGYTSSVGQPIAITWSLPPDGTPTSAPGANSLLASLDQAFKVTDVAGDLRLRPWFPIVQSAVERWGELSGVQFAYEPLDDGAVIGPSSGVFGVRGDIRIGGHTLNGAGGALALSNLPDSADILLDTADIAFLAFPDENYLRLRNVLAHEVGHALGLGHIESNDAKVLMEPHLDLSYDGPQIDDIRGIHWMYGDFNERSNGGAGNGSPILATPMGRLSSDMKISVGSDASHQGVIGTADRDFVSITNSLDVDVYSFRTNSPLGIEISLAPLGGTYHQGANGGPQSLVDAASRSNLKFELLGADDQGVLAIADNAPAGLTERLTIDLPMAGDYHVRVSGSFHAVQLYQLELTAVSLDDPPTPQTPEPSTIAFAATIAITTASIQPWRCIA